MKGELPELDPFSSANGFISLFSDLVLRGSLMDRFISFSDFESERLPAFA